MASVAVIVLALGVDGYFSYQNHLSGEVKGLLIAANDQNASEIEVRAYIAQARPLVRTRKDRETLDTFQKGVSLMLRVEEDQRADGDELRDTLQSISHLVEGDESDRCMGHMWTLIHIRDQYQENRIRVPDDLRKQVESAYNDGKMQGR